MIEPTRVRVQAATRADLGGVAAVAATTWRAAYAGVIPEADLERTLVSLGAGLLVVADDDGVVG